MSTIITRNSATSGSTPSSLVQGELAINVTDGRLFYGSGSGNVVKEFTTLSASYAATASYLLGSIESASYATTASYALTAQTLLGTVVSASHALTASYVNPLNQVVQITGSLNISGSIFNPNSIYFYTTASGVTQVGQLGWDDGYGTLNLMLKGGNVDVELGQENVVLVFNNSGTTLNKGEIVFVSGSQGNRPSVNRALATTDGYSVTTLGFAAESITSGAEGYITTFGFINNINTSGSIGGTPVWLSPTVPGGWTTTKPQAPDHTVLLGYIVRVSPTVGSIFVHISNGWEIDELHDVRIISASNGDLLTRSGSLWINTKQLSGSYGLTGSLTATSFTGSLFGTAATASYASGTLVAPGSTTQILYNNNGIVAATSSFVYSGSNVGIGTPTPSPTSGFIGLNLKSPAAFGAELKIDTTDAGRNSSVTFAEAGVNKWQLYLDSSNGSLKIGDSVAPATTPLTILNDGNIGVGKTDPSTKLDISGSVLITGSLNVNNGTNIKLDTATSLLIDDSNINSVDWQNRTLIDTAGNTSIDWPSRIGFDASGNSSIDWDSKVLYDNTTNAIIDYSGNNGLNVTNYRPTLEPLTAVVQEDFTQTAVGLYGIATNIAGNVIEVDLNIDLAVTASDLTFLDTDGIWKRTNQTTDTSTKLLGICVEPYNKGTILMEGTITVTTSSGYTDIPLVSGTSFYGMPVYFTGSAATFTTDKPTSGYVRVAGHMYYNSTTNPDYWIMKFNPSNDWYQI